MYLHLDCREAHYAKVMLNMLFGRECFLNEIIWAYDYGALAKKRRPAKHDNILVYVKDPDRHHCDSASVDREPYMAPGPVIPDKSAKGKLPTDVWWHTPESGSSTEPPSPATPAVSAQAAPRATRRLGGTREEAR